MFLGFILLFVVNFFYLKTNKNLLSLSNLNNVCFKNLACHSSFESKNECSK